MTKTENYFEKQLRDYAQQGVDSKLFAGAGIGFSDKGIATYAYSNSLLPDSTIPFSENTLHDLASMTKSAVAIALVMAIEQGVLKLDDLLCWYVPGTGKRWGEITIQHLLTNSLKFDIKQRLHEYSFERINDIITTANVLALGDGWYYHNSNSILFGWVLEKIYNKPLAHILRKLIFEPAGMNNTFFPSEIPESMYHHVHPSLNKKFIGPNVLKGIPHDQIAYQYAVWGQNVACSGMFSTVKDVVSFGNFMLYKAFKDPKTMLAKIAFNYLQQFKHESGLRQSAGLGFDNPKPDYVCKCFEEQAVISTGHTGVFMCVHTIQQKVLVILANITYPASVLERQNDELGIPKNPLFDYRKKLTNLCFPCEQHCTQ